MMIKNEKGNTAYFEGISTLEEPDQNTNWEEIFKFCIHQKSINFFIDKYRMYIWWIDKNSYPQNKEEAIEILEFIKLNGTEDISLKVQKLILCLS